MSTYNIWFHEEIKCQFFLVKKNTISRDQNMYCQIT